MKFKRLAILTLVAVLAPSGGAWADQGTTADPAVMTTVNAALNAARSGDVDRLRDQYVPSATLADVAAPVPSSGASGIDSYLPIALEMLKDPSKSGIKLTAGTPKFSYEAGPTACVVVPLTVVGKLAGMPFTVSRSLAFTLRKTPAGWKISTQTLVNYTAPDVRS